MKHKGILSCSIFAAVLAMLVLSGCGGQEKEVVDVQPMEQEEVYTYSLDAIGGTDVMPIAGYYGPCLPMHSYGGSTQPSNLTEEWYQAVADCGINLLSNPQIDYAVAPNAVMKSLELAAKYGIAQTVYDSNVMGHYDLTKEEIVELMQPYMTHPGFSGFFLYDEPGNAEFISYRTQISQLVNLSDILNNELGMYVYDNITGADVEKADIYANYVREYCETLGMKYLSYDRYPDFDPEKATYDFSGSYFWNMALVRQYAEEYEMPWWAFANAGGQHNDSMAYIESTEYYPDEGETYWTVNMPLAFGAKGISWFALTQPYYFAYGPEEGVYDFERNCIFGAYGNKNCWYYYAQNVNRQIAAVDEVLMNSVNKGILATGDAVAQMSEIKEENQVDPSVVLPGASWRELENITGDTVVGCFNYLGKTALYVVNYKWDYAQKVDLTFVKECNIKVIQDAEVSYVKGDSMTLDLAAGTAALLVFE